MGYEPVIGLEVHCQLKTRTKIFAPDEYAFGAAANSGVGPVTLGLPGVLPVLNEEVLDLAIRAGLALNCKIAEITKFDRKHYFYPDLPKGYQISQYDMPYALGGHVSFLKQDAQTETRVNLTRIHMEEDAGKLVHGGRAGESLVDLNRAGVPLLEIVSEPDLRSSEDAYYYLQTLRGILRWVGVSDCNMEEGTLRCDANVSVRPGPDAPYGTRVEIKNLNSFRNVRMAIDHEIERQIDLIEGGGQVVQSTVLWDADKRETRLMRTKEDAEDYRYFPDPDLTAFHIPAAKVDAIRASLPELPAARRDRFMQDFGLPRYDAEVLTKEKEVAEYFEAAAGLSGDPKKTSNWVMAEVLGVLNKTEQPLDTFACTAPRLGRMLKLLNDGAITSKMAKKVFEHIYTEDLDPEAVIDKYGYRPVDAAALPAIVDKVFADNPESIEKILAGQDKVKGFLVGQVMKATQGQAPPQEVNRLIDQKIEGLKK